MSTRYLARFHDPDGSRYGLPTYQWQCAPLGLHTRRQLRDLGLCPGGQEPVAQVMWRRRGEERVAYLYDLNKARRKRTATAAVWAALGKALEARRTCSTCHQVKGYTIPRSLGECMDCADGAPMKEAA